MDLQCCFLPISWLLLRPDCCSLFPCLVTDPNQTVMDEHAGSADWRRCQAPVCSDNWKTSDDDCNIWLEGWKWIVLAFVQVPNASRSNSGHGRMIILLVVFNLFLYKKKKSSNLPHPLVLFHVLMPQFCLEYYVQIKTLFEVLALKNIFFPFPLLMSFIGWKEHAVVTPPTLSALLLTTATGYRLK